MTDILKVQNFSVDSATRRVVDDVSVEVSSGKIAALLGPNGAGKTELVLGIAGVMPSTGALYLNEQLLSGGDAQTIRGMGIAAIPEGHQILAGMNVTDNLKASGPMLSDEDLDEEVENALEIFPELKKLANNKAGLLSGGQQQMLAIAQALISRPKFLLIDEMSLGLAPVIIERLVEVVKELANKGAGILLIEQFTQLALGLADHCYVMSQGRIQYSGSPDKLKNDPAILDKAYLGA